MRNGLLIGLLILGGCVSTRNAPLSADRTRTLQGKTLAVSNRPRADFVAMTAGKAAFALVGTVAMIEAGNAIVKDNGIDDPTILLGQNLISEAEVHYGVVAAASPIVVIDTTDLAKMARAASNADLLLDVQSLGSQFRYFPTDWSHYAVDSAYKVRLLDVSSVSLIAEGFCRQTTQREPSPPTKDQLLADNAARLKSILEAQRDACLQQLKRNIFGVT